VDRLAAVPSVQGTSPATAITTTTKEGPKMSARNLLSCEQRIEVLEAIVKGLVDIFLDSPQGRGALMLQVNENLNDWMKRFFLEYAAELIYRESPLIAAICDIKKYVSSQNKQLEGSAEALDHLRQQANAEARDLRQAAEREAA
jgi:hypothetical protein